jgi:hypothetical protein
MNAQGKEKGMHFIFFDVVYVCKIKTFFCVSFLLKLNTFIHCIMGRAKLSLNSSGKAIEMSLVFAHVIHWDLI